MQFVESRPAVQNEVVHGMRSTSGTQHTFLASHFRATRQCYNMLI